MECGNWTGVPGELGAEGQKEMLGQRSSGGRASAGCSPFPGEWRAQSAAENKGVGEGLEPHWMLEETLKELGSQLTR